MACPVCPTCPKPMAAASNGAFQGDSPIDFALPLLIIQVSFVLALTRALAFVLRPLRQPRVIAEMIGGILLGPSAFGRNSKYLNDIFPKKSIPVLDTFAQIGLIFFLFMVGMELDLKTVRKTGKVAVMIAAAGITVPFAAGVGVSFVLHSTIAQGGKTLPFIVFMGVAMSITAFPVLARILAERKLLTTDVGQMAMSAAAVNDVVAWILLALAIALSGTNRSPAIAAWVLLCGVGFVLLMFLVVKPFMEWIVNQHAENEPMRESHICITLAAVLAAGFVTDVIGIHAIFGAFIFGLVVPKEGQFASTMTEKLEDIVTILMLPLYFAASGLKTDIKSIKGGQSGALLLLVIAVACGGKIIGTFIVARMNKMDVRRSLTLGFLMNTKGLVELIVLNIGRDKGVLNTEVFAIMVVMALFTTFMTTPVVMAIYKPARNQIPYTDRTLDVDREKKELRMLACIRGIQHVQAMMNITEAARGTRKRAIRLYILHLVQMSERTSDILLVQRARKNGLPHFKTGTDSAGGSKDQITIAFEAYAQLSKVAVRPMTAISRFEDMHEDVCSTAAEKRVRLLILPFHKHQATDGLLDQGKAAYRSVNQKILDHAPCSVAIVVNRGLGEHGQNSPGQVDHFALILFFGGPDDREALSLGCRMAEHPGVKLKIIRFLPEKNAEHVVDWMPEDASTSAATRPGHSRKASRELTKVPGSPSNSFYVFQTAGVDHALERKLDEHHLAAAKQSNPQLAADGSESVQYEEHHTSDAVSAALEFGKREEFDLILVGSCRTPCPLVARSAGQVQEFVELGPIGDALACELQGPPTKATVIVIQQYNSALQKE